MELFYNKVTSPICEYKSGGGYVKQMRKESEKFKITENNTGKIFKKSRFLWKIKKNGRVEGKEAKVHRNDDMSDIGIRVKLK